MSDQETRGAREAIQQMTRRIRETTGADQATARQQARAAAIRHDRRQEKKENR